MLVMEMSNKKQQIPAIRFNGFTDAWEQRKLGDTFEFSVSTNSLSRAQLNYEKGNIKSIHYGDILIKYNSILEITKDKIPFITDGSIEKYKPNLLENGDVVFADAAEDETVGKAVEINGISDEYVVAGLHTIVARPKEKMAKYFSGYYINADVYQRQLLRLMQGTKVSSISKGNLKKTIVAYPKNLAEQQKIGSFFKQLDDTIALHQRQLNDYKQLKKSMLQKMFPQDGEKVPKIRFDGFTKEWEQRKLGDCFAERNERMSEGELISVTINSGVVKASSLDRKDNSSEDKSNYKKVEIGDIAYNSMRMWQGASGVSRYSGILSPAYTVIVPKKQISSVFFSYLFKLNKMIQTFQANSQGLTSDTWNLKYPVLKDIKVYVPNYEEQNKIGNFFKQLDDTIAFHQRQLNDYKQLKKSMLQKMFPQDGEKVPKIRFDGFTKEWEQRKLGDCFAERNERMSEGELISVTINSGVVKASSLDRKDNSSEDKSNYKKVEIGDIAYNSMRMWQGASGVSRYSGILSPAYTVIVPKKQISSVFFSYLFKLNKMIQTFQANSQGLTSDTWNLKYPVLKDIKVYVPNYEEQNKIGNFFKQLDDTIAFHQQKVNDYQQLKKVMLQQMFV